MLPDVDLTGIVKDNQHLDVMPGEGPRKIFYSVAAAEDEATEAFKEIRIAVPGSDNEHDSVMGSVEDGVDNGKMKYSVQAAKDQARKRNK